MTKREVTIEALSRVAMEIEASANVDDQIDFDDDPKNVQKMCDAMREIARRLDRWRLRLTREA